MTRPAPVVFVHGAGMDHTIWRFQSRWLAGRGHTVGLVDLPGHGSSTEQPRGSIDAMAAWLVRWLDDFEADRPVILVGHSMGSFVCLETALIGSAVAGLVLVGTGTRMEVNPALMTAARSDLPRAAQLIAGWSYPSAHRGAHPEPGTWQAGATERLIRRSRPGALAAGLAACAAYHPLARGPEVAVRTRIVAGSEDRMTPARSAQRLADAMPAARFMTIDGCGHEVMAQDPRSFNRILAGFLDEL